jgi:hypothetical protein
MSWINVKDRLPEDGQEVIACNYIILGSSPPMVLDYSEQSGFWGFGCLYLKNQKSLITSLSKS